MSWHEILKECGLKEVSNATNKHYETVKYWAKKNRVHSRNFKALRPVLFKLGGYKLTTQQMRELNDAK